MSNNNYEDAIFEFDKILLMNPDHEKARSLRSEAQKKQKEKDQEKDLALIQDYLEKIRSYNIKLGNKARDAKDKLTKEMEEEMGPQEFRKLIRVHHNEQLTDFAKNSDVIDRIIEYKDHLHQKIEPIYLDPQQKLVRAHFYAPRKQVFGSYFDTFWVNIIMIWLKTITFYVILYFRLLKRLLDSFEELSYRINKGQ